MFVRYYAVHIINQNDSSTDHIPKIPRCIIAYKVIFYFNIFRFEISNPLIILNLI